MLTAFFQKNAQSPAARQIFYDQFPLHYFYDRKASCWQDRKRRVSTIIGRLSFISPRQLELYSLKKLLLNRCGSVSFQDLRTIDGIVYDTFCQAATHLGLIRDDDELRKTLQEGALIQMPRQLRYLFAHICIHCQPAPNYVINLFNEFKADMCEDFTRNNRYMIVQAEALTLNHLNRIFEQMGYTCVSFGLNMPPAILPQRVHDPNELGHVDNVVVINPIELNEQVSNLNVEQRTCYDNVIIIAH